MSTETIIIVGFALIIIAILGNIKRNSSSTLVSPKITIPLGIVGVLMTMYGSYSSGLINYSSQIEQVSIGQKLKITGPIDAVKVVSPIDQDSVDCRILTMGVYPEAHDKDIWVVIKPSDGKYYPQSDHTNTSYKAEGEWQVITRFGGDLGEAYDLIIYETDAIASSFFSSTIEEWKESNDYAGLKPNEIPAGAKEMENLKVYSRKNCRGLF